MALDVPTLRSRLNAGSKLSDERGNELIAFAKALVDDWVTAQGEDVTFPGSIVDEATMLVAIEKYRFDNAPNGTPTQQYDETGQGATPIRIRRNPLDAGLDLLTNYSIPAIG